MNNSYSIIDNLSEVEEFLDLLPHLDETEAYFVSCFARKKYGANKDVMLRRTVANSKSKIPSKLRALEVPFGNFYYDDNNTVPILTQLSVYINPNPRDIEKANFNTALEITRNSRDGIFKSPVSVALTEVQKSSGTKHFIHFDVDTLQKEDYIAEIRNEEMVNKEAVTLIETQGGFHVLIKSDLVDSRFKKDFYLNFKQRMDTDISGDQLLPIPGCFQTLTFTPKLIKL